MFTSTIYLLGTVGIEEVATGESAIGNQVRGQIQRSWTGCRWWHGRVCSQILWSQLRASWGGLHWFVFPAPSRSEGAHWNYGTHARYMHYTSIQIEVFVDELCDVRVGYCLQTDIAEFRKILSGWYSPILFSCLLIRRNGYTFGVYDVRFSCSWSTLTFLLCVFDRSERWRN